MLHCCQSLSCLPVCLCVCACVCVCVCVSISICRPPKFSVPVSHRCIASTEAFHPVAFHRRLRINTVIGWLLEHQRIDISTHSQGHLGGTQIESDQYHSLENNGFVRFLDDSRGRLKWEVRPKVFQLSPTVVTRSLELRAERETVHSSYLLWSFAHRWFGVISVNMEISFPGSVFA